MLRSLHYGDDRIPAAGDLLGAELRSQRHQNVPRRYQGVTILRCPQNGDDHIPAACDLLGAQLRGQRHETIRRRFQHVTFLRILENADERMSDSRDLIGAQRFHSVGDEISEFGELGSGFGVGTRSGWVAQPGQGFRQRGAGRRIQAQEPAMRRRCGFGDRLACRVVWRT